MLLRKQHSLLTTENSNSPILVKKGVAIFQRALDDILRKHIGECRRIYIDDIILSRKGENEYLENFNIAFKTLEEANMKINLEKCKLLKDMVSVQSIKTNPKKIKTNASFSLPGTLKDPRSTFGI